MHVLSTTLASLFTSISEQQEEEGKLNKRKKKKGGDKQQREAGPGGMEGWTERCQLAIAAKRSVAEPRS